MTSRPPVPDAAGWVADYYPAVFKYLRYRGLATDDANDLAAAAFERAFERRASFDPRRGAFKTWLFAIVRHALSNHWRAERVRQALPLAAAEQQPSPEPLPEAVVVARETRAELLRALRTLNPHEQDLIALKFSARLTNREIAALTGLSESHVGVSLFRALQKLRRCLAPAEEAHP